MDFVFKLKPEAVIYELKDGEVVASYKKEGFQLANGTKIGKGHMRNPEGKEVPVVFMKTPDGRLFFSEVFHCALDPVGKS